MDDTGRVSTYINNRGTSGMTPSWDAVGQTHGGVATANQRSQIYLTKLYGSGRSDVRADTETTGLWYALTRASRALSMLGSSVSMAPWATFARTR